MRIFLLFLCLSITILSCSNSYYFRNLFRYAISSQSFFLKRELDYSWTKHRAIAHALGVHEGKTKTNSLEAFETSIKRGFKLFEADLIFTSDNVLVAHHDWKNDRGERVPLSLKEFQTAQSKQKLTVLTFRKTAEILNQHKDVYLITDTKSFDLNMTRRQFENIVRICREINPEILDRIIPQIYREEMLEYIEKVHPFKSYIYTLYWAGEQRRYPERIANFAHWNNISVVTIPLSLVNAELITTLKRKNITVYVHTINEEQQAKDLLQKGIHGLYTDTLNTGLRAHF